MDKPALTSSKLTLEYRQMHFPGRATEVIEVIFLDSRHRVLAVEDLFFDAIDAASVYPREIICNALLRNAAAVVLAHKISLKGGQSRVLPRSC